jgi:RNA polymerase sigma-70 factor (TIGR02943 family)
MDAPTALDPARWVKEHGDYLFRFALSRLRNRAAAEDTVQETFLAALKARDRFNGLSSERAWLMGILKHKVVDHIRKAAREAPLDAGEDSSLTDRLLFKVSGVPTMHPPRWHFNPRKAFEQKEFWGVFTDCLGRLNARLHTAFVLKELEGLSTEAVCKELQVTANNLWVILHRAREQLKSCLEQNWIQINQGKT